MRPYLCSPLEVSEGRGGERGREEVVVEVSKSCRGFWQVKPATQQTQESGVGRDYESECGFDFL